MSNDVPKPIKQYHELTNSEIAAVEEKVVNGSIGSTSSLDLLSEIDVPLGDITVVLKHNDVNRILRQYNMD